MPDRHSVKIYEVGIRFRIRGSEIDIESNGRGDLPARYREAQVYFTEAFGLMCRDQLRELGELEGLVITVDGMVEYDQAQDEGASDA